MFKLTFETNNAAFDGAEGEGEVARILESVASALRRGTTGAPIFDHNGNRIGRFDLTADS